MKKFEEPKHPLGEPVITHHDPPPYVTLQRENGLGLEVTPTEDGLKIVPRDHRPVESSFGGSFFYRPEDKYELALTYDEWGDFIVAVDRARRASRVSR